MFVVHRGGGTRLSDQAYEQVKHLIVSGSFPPGTHLTERDLMAQLDMGRTPLREALQRLVRDHFLTVVPGGGYFVTAITNDGAMHIYELRRPIEGLAARLAAERATAADIEALRAFVHTAERTPPDEADGYWHLGLDGEFHDLIARATGNAYLRTTVSELFSLTQRVLISRRPEVPTVEVELPFYHELTDAIANRDPDKAETLMLEHLGTIEIHDGVHLG